jgi:TolA-binding protein
MILGDTVDLTGLTVTDLILLVGFMAVVVDRVADARGWSKSSKRLREENLDLARINAEVAARAKDLAAKVRAAETNITELRAEMDILKMRDQEAVLLALANHEVMAEKRHNKTAELLVGTTERTAGLLGEIRDAIRTKE